MLATLGYVFRKLRKFVCLLFVIKLTTSTSIKNRKVVLIVQKWHCLILVSNCFDLKKTALIWLEITCTKSWNSTTKVRLLKLQQLNRQGRRQTNISSRAWLQMTFTIFFLVWMAGSPPVIRLRLYVLDVRALKKTFFLQAGSG